MHRVDLLIFDLDGTLVDSRQDLTNAVNYARKELGLSELDIPSVSRLVGNGVHKLLERSLPENMQDKIDQAMILFKEFYHDHAVDFTITYPGVFETLAYFRDKKKAIMTNKPYSFTRQILDRLQIRSHFNVIVGGDSLPVMKPSPDPVLYILRQLEIAPEQTVMIGDGVTDIEAGRQAQVMTCAVTYGLKGKETLRQAKPDFFIDDIRQLCELFT